MEIGGLNVGELSIIMGTPGVGKSFWMENERHKEIVKLCSDNEFANLLLEKIDDETLQIFINKND